MTDCKSPFNTSLNYIQINIFFGEKRKIRQMSSMINLARPPSLARSEHCFHLKFMLFWYIFKSGDRRTDVRYAWKLLLLPAVTGGRPSGSKMQLAVKWAAEYWVRKTCPYTDWTKLHFVLLNKRLKTQLEMTTYGLSVQENYTPHKPFLFACKISGYVTQ